ncbi:hypothetical protein D9M72_452660 [compost metagenome]
MRAVVLLQLDQPAHAELVLEVAHIADVGATERIDALVVVADGKDRGRILRAVAGQQLEPLVLQHVGVLELVDQHVAEAVLVMLADGVVVAQQFVAAQQQLGEVDHAFALALQVVGGVEVDKALVEVVVGLDVGRAQALLLGVVDEVLQVLGRVLLIIDIERLEQPLERRELVLAVQDGKGLGQARVAEMRAQHAVAQAVEGADPHAAGVDRQHRRQPRLHFLGGLVGKGHRQDARRRDPAVLDQPGDARGQHAGLAAARARQDQRRFVRQGDGG